MNYYCYYNSAIGRLTIECSDLAITGLWLPNCKHCPSLPNTTELPNHPLLESAIRWLDQYFAGDDPDPNTLPLEPVGSAFQTKVWTALQRIPYGQVVSYRDIATVIGHPDACQAVGAAVGRNPISIIIPCHRVIGANGSLTGYAGGLTAKAFLLSHESKSKQFKLAE